MAEIERIEKRRGGARPGSGMKKGQKTRKTIEKEAAREAYQQMVLQNLRPLFQKQLWLAMGQTYVYRKEKHGTGASMRIEHVLLEDPREIADALDTIGNADFQDDNDGFVYITTKAPDNRSIDSMLDRSVGKPSQPISGDKDNPLELITVVKYAGTKPSA